MYSAIFIDDEDLIRENIKYLADYEGNNFSLSAVFSNLGDAKKYMKKNRVDLVMVDIIIGDESGLDFAEYCAAKYPETLVAVISAYEKFEFARRALECNVFSYISKPSGYEELTDMLKKAGVRLNAIYKNKKKRDMIRNGNEKVQMTKKFIEENIVNHKDVTREQVAEYIGMTPTYFSKWFKNNFSTSFTHYVNNVKIQYSMTLLRETKLNLNEISLECGYYALHYFMNKFYEINGMTPNEYRKKHRENEK